MPRTLTPDDFYAIKQVEDARISPDGTRIAYVFVEVDRDAYQYHRSIWLVPVAGGEPVRFTTGPNDSAPRWSPDGRSLAFLRAPAGKVKPANASERDQGKGQPQLWLLPVDGGEARQLTTLRYGAGPTVWSPDSATLLFAARTGDPDDDEAADAELAGKDVPRVRTITNLWHRLDGTGYIYEQRAHLFTLPVAGGTPRQLTDGDWNDDEPAWSPDGSRIAFSSDRSDLRWRVPGPSVWVMPATGGEPTRVTSEDLACAAPAWSPDGATLAFIAAPRRGETGHADLYVVPAQAGAGDARCLTLDFVPVCDDRCIDDQRDHTHMHLTWSPDGKAVYFLASMRGATHVYAARPSDDLLPYRITDGDCHIFAYSLDREGQTLALGQSDPLVPSDIYAQVVASPATGGEAPAARRLTNINAALLADVALAGQDEFAFHTDDGWELQGWVMRPTTTSKGNPTPAVLQIHGGPAYMYGYSFFLEFQLLAAQGYAVIFSNPRGGVGYGRVFTHAITQDWGNKDYRDLMASLDAALALGGIDGARLGVAGGSYGGYMTNWIVGHSDRFKAGVTMRCVSNFATMFGTSDIGWELAVDEWGGTPWDDLEKLMHGSPITYVANIHTPLLILHSDNDLRCPIGEGEQLFSALSYLGRTTKLVRFEGQSHGLSRGGHPRSRVIRFREILDWFDSYIPA